MGTKVLLSLSDPSGGAFAFHIPNLSALFAEYNAEHFNNTIPEVPVIWNSRLSVTAGRIHYNKRVGSIQKVELSESIFAKMDYSLAEIRETLLHEMVHAYLIYYRRDDSHGRQFQNMMCRIMGEYKNYTYHSYEVKNNKRRERDVAVICEHCGTIGYRKNLSSRRLFHTGCNGRVTLRRISL